MAWFSLKPNFLLEIRCGTRRPEDEFACAEVGKAKTMMPAAHRARTLKLYGTEYTENQVSAGMLYNVIA